MISNTIFLPNSFYCFHLSLKLKYQIMRKLLLYFALFNFSISVFAQSDLFSAQKNRIIGKNYRTNEIIRAKEYVFSQPIYRLYSDSLTRTVTLLLSEVGLTENSGGNTGTVVWFDLINSFERWYKPIDYNKSIVRQVSNFLFEITNKGTYCLGLNSGVAKWELKHIMYHIDAFHRIGLGYKHKLSKETSVLEGLDLKEGKPLWKRNIKNTYGWTDILQLTDSSVLVVASGLHHINLKNGSGWDFDTQTGQLDYQMLSGSKLASITNAMLSGFYQVPVGQEVVWDVNSDVLKDSATYFFASRESVSRIGFDGTVKWSTGLPIDKSSKSEIFLQNNVLYVVNMGYAFVSQNYLNYGSPFLAAYDKVSGKQLFLVNVSEKKERVNSYKVHRDTICLVFNNHIERYSLKTGKFISDHKFEMTLLGQLFEFIDNNVYIESGSSFVKLENSDTTKYFLVTAKDKILITNHNFEPKSQIDYRQVYVFRQQINNLKVISGFDETVVLDENNKIVARLDIKYNYIFVGTRLVLMDNDKLVWYDFKNLLN
jgi:hypothetical protein